MRRYALLLALLGALVPSVSLAQQDVRLRGAFVPLRAPEGEVRTPVGEARMLVEEDGDLRLDLVVSGLTERATSATLHLGRGGESSEQVARMDVAMDGNVARVIGGTADLTPLVAARVRAGDAFIVLRTNEHPDGFLRAQLAVQPASLGTVVGP